MRFLAIVLSTALYLAFLPQSFAQSLTDAEVKMVASIADSILEQEPRFAADCQYAYAMSEALARESDFLVIVPGNDEEKAQGARLMTNVWGLVLYREAVRAKKDPMKVKSRLKREIARRDFINRKRMRNGPIAKIEDQIDECYKAMYQGEQN